jgi:hypothetical protein
MFGELVDGLEETRERLRPETAVAFDDPGTFLGAQRCELGLGEDDQRLGHGRRGTISQDHGTPVRASRTGGAPMPEQASDDGLPIEAPEPV